MIVICRVCLQSTGCSGKIVFFSQESIIFHLTPRKHWAAIGCTEIGQGNRSNCTLALFWELWKSKKRYVVEGWIAVDNEKTQFFLNTLYVFSSLASIAPISYLHLVRNNLWSSLSVWNQARQDEQISPSVSETTSKLKNVYRAVISQHFSIWKTVMSKYAHSDKINMDFFNHILLEV